MLPEVGSLGNSSTPRAKKLVMNERGSLRIAVVIRGGLASILFKKEEGLTKTAVTMVKNKMIWRYL